MKHHECARKRTFRSSERLVRAKKRDGQSCKHGNWDDCRSNWVAVSDIFNFVLGKCLGPCFFKESLMDAKMVEELAKKTAMSRLLKCWNKFAELESSERSIVLVRPVGSRGFDFVSIYIYIYITAIWRAER